MPVSPIWPRHAREVVIWEASGALQQPISSVIMPFTTEAPWGFRAQQESAGARAVVAGIGAPLVPTVVSGVAGQQAEEAAFVRSHVDAPVCDRRLERDGLAERDLPQHIAGPFRERVDLARGSPDEHLAVHDGGRREDIVDTSSFPCLMQVVGPDHLAGLRVDAPGVGAHRAVKPLVVNERLRPLVGPYAVHAGLPDVDEGRAHLGRPLVGAGKTDGCIVRLACQLFYGIGALGVVQIVCLLARARYS